MMAMRRTIAIDRLVDDSTSAATHLGYSDRERTQLLFLQALPGNRNVSFSKDLRLTTTPLLERVNYGTLWRISPQLLNDPVRCAQQFKAVRRGKSIDHLKNLIDRFLELHIAMLFDPRIRRCLCILRKRDRMKIEHALSSVAIPSDQMAFHTLKLMIQILGVRSVLRFLIAQTHRRSDSLKQIHEFLEFEQRCSTRGLNTL